LRKSSEVSPAEEEIYPLIEPHAYAKISRDDQTAGFRYLVIEPTLTETEIGVLGTITEALFQTFSDLSSLQSRHDCADLLVDQIREIVVDREINVSEEVLNKIEYYIVRDVMGYGKIEPLMRDHFIEDISCDGAGIPIYVWHRQHESIPTNITFEHERELNHLIDRLARATGKHPDTERPLLDMSLPDGSRVSLIYGREVSGRGSSFAIRRFRADPLTMTDLIDFGFMNLDMAAWLWFVIEKKANVMIGGGTASGKTTTLNCLSMLIPPDDKVVSIEETRELNLPRENWISLVSRPSLGESTRPEISLFDLLKAAMRLRPDYIISGEARGAETYTLFQAMATGYGSLSTIHCDSVRGMISRLETEPMRIPRELLKLLDIIIIQSRIRLSDRMVRRIELIAELEKNDSASKELGFNEAFRLDPQRDLFLCSGKSSQIDRIAKRYGLDQEAISQELQRRKMFFEWTVRNRIRRYNDLSRVIREYYADPEGVMKKVIGHKLT